MHDTPVVNLVQAAEYETGDRLPRAQHYDMSRVPVLLLHFSCGIDNVISFENQKTWQFRCFQCLCLDKE